MVVRLFCGQARRLIALLLGLLVLLLVGTARRRRGSTITPRMH